MTYKNQLPHDDYSHSEEIYITRFAFAYTRPEGTVVQVRHDERFGDSVCVCGNYWVCDEDFIELFMGDDFDHYLSALEAERTRLGLLKKEMEEFEVFGSRNDQADAEYDYRRTSHGV